MTTPEEAGLSYFLAHQQKPHVRTREDTLRVNVSVLPLQETIPEIVSLEECELWWQEGKLGDQTDKFVAQVPFERQERMGLQLYQRLIAQGRDGKPSLRFVYVPHLDAFQVLYVQPLDRGEYPIIRFYTEDIYREGGGMRKSSDVVGVRVTRIEGYKVRP